MKFKLGQKIKYKRVIRKVVFDIEKKDFDDVEIVRVSKIKIVELSKERSGFIVGKRRLAEKAEYTFNDDDPNCFGHIEHEKTETKEVYKVAYDMAHTNYVLEEDLKEVT